MRFVGHQDVPVLLGLAAALLLTFLNPLARLVGAPPTPLGELGIAALPGLLVLGGVLGFDRWRRRSAFRALGTQLEAAARLAEARGLELERFVSFGRALARVVDADGITSAIRDYLAPMAGTPGVSVLLSNPAGWELFAGDRSAADELLARVHAADTALVGTASDAHFPLRVLGETIGLLVIRRDRRDIDPETLHALDAAAAMIAITVKSLLLFRELRETNLRDTLTGCAARAHGLDVIDGELRRARRSQSAVSLVLIDVDRLKDINSRYGHVCGDAVLAMVGRRLRKVLRRSDLKCRYGGEEFLVLLPETALIGARRVAEALRREIADRPMPWDGDAITVTASLGVTQVLPGEVGLDAIIARAESAARRAQEEGHNTVRVASDSLVSLDKASRAE